MALARKRKEEEEERLRLEALAGAEADVVEELVPIDTASYIEAAKASLKTDIFGIRTCAKGADLGAKIRRKHREIQFDPQNIRSLVVEDLFEFDLHGWSPIHYAVFKGFYASVEIMITEVPSLLEWRTWDRHFQWTPLHLAVMSGDLQTVKQLFEFGADLTTTNKKGHSVVHMCTFQRYDHILEYLLTNAPAMSIWKELVHMLDCVPLEDVEAAIGTIEVMTRKDEHGALNPNWKEFYDANLVQILCKVAAKNNSDKVKKDIFQTMLNILEPYEVKRISVDSNIFPIMIMLMTNPDSVLIYLIGQTAVDLCAIPEFVAVAIECGFIEAIVGALMRDQKIVTLISLINLLRVIIEGRPDFQKILGETKDGIETIVWRFQGVTSETLLHSLLQLCGALVMGHAKNKTRFCQCGGPACFTKLVDMRIKNPPIVMAAIEATNALVYHHLIAQRAAREADIMRPLMFTLKHNAYQRFQEMASMTLWTIAGEDLYWQLIVAETMGVRLLQEFMQGHSIILQYIGSEGIGTLAYSPLSLHDAINQVNAILAITKLLQLSIKGGAETELVLLSVLQTLRHCCVRVGYTPCRSIQEGFVNYGGVEMLVDLMLNAEKMTLQAEAAYALGCVGCHNIETMTAIRQTEGFHFVHIVNMYHCSIVDVQILASQALCAFAYNSPRNQADIDCAGNSLLFSTLEPHMWMPNKTRRAVVAFQSIILSPIFRDSKQASATRDGVNHLSDLVDHFVPEANEKALIVQKQVAITLNYICGCLHTRPGIPESFLSSKVIDSLVGLISWKSEHVRGYAAIALGYLSSNLLAKRQILRILRRTPYLFDVWCHYTKNNKLNPDVYEDWKHSVELGHAPHTGPKDLIREPVILLAFEVRPLTVTGAETEIGGSLRGKRTESDDDDVLELLDIHVQRERVRIKNRAINAELKRLADEVETKRLEAEAVGAMKTSGDGAGAAASTFGVGGAHKGLELTTGPCEEDGLNSECVNKGPASYDCRKVNVDLL